MTYSVWAYYLSLHFEIMVVNKVGNDRQTYTDSELDKRLYLAGFFKSI